MEEPTVTIDAGRYEELLDKETRVFIAKGMILRDRCIRMSDLLFILGFSAEAKKIDDEEKEELRRIMGKEEENE
mgnify:CR=1 FL=1